VIRLLQGRLRTCLDCRSAPEASASGPRRQGTAGPRCRFGGFAPPRASAPGGPHRASALRGVGNGCTNGPRRGTKPMEGTSVGRWQRRSDGNELRRRSKASKPIRSAMIRRARIPPTSVSAMQPPGTRVAPVTRTTPSGVGSGGARGSDHSPRWLDLLVHAAPPGAAPTAEVLRSCPASLRRREGTSRSVTWGSASADRSFIESDRRPASAGR
jgi:hypothetical protein